MKVHLQEQECSGYDILNFDPIKQVLGELI